MALCSWLRLPKLLISFKTLTRNEQNTSIESKESSSRRKIFYLACTVFSVAHFCACGWFYIGNQYEVWYTRYSRDAIKLQF